MLLRNEITWQTIGLKKCWIPEERWLMSEHQKNLRVAKLTPLSEPRDIFVLSCFIWRQIIPELLIWSLIIVLCLYLIPTDKAAHIHGLLTRIKSISWHEWVELPFLPIPYWPVVDPTRMTRKRERPQVLNNPLFILTLSMGFNRWVLRWFPISAIARTKTRNSMLRKTIDQLAKSIII